MPIVYFMEIKMLFIIFNCITCFITVRSWTSRMANLPLLVRDIIEVIAPAPTVNVLI